MEEKQKGIATSIIDSINLLSIKKTVRLLLELESDVIEEFVKQYSAIMIFLLNILDQERSQELLQKLTDYSILYIVEEEMRFLLIREFAMIPPEIVPDLSMMIEHVDSPASYSDIHNRIHVVLNYILNTKTKRKKINFAYMNAVSRTRLDNLIILLLDRNKHAVFGMLPYASHDILCIIFDGIAKKLPVEMKNIPIELINIRFKQKYEDLLVPGIYEYLPDDIKDRIEMMNEIKIEHESSFKEIDRLHKMNDTAMKKNQQIINVVYKIMKMIKPELHEMYLNEFHQKGILSENQIFILNSMFKQL